MLERVRTVPRTAQDFAAQIRTSWQKAVESILKTGKLLIAAKKALGHGKWATMFDGPNKLPFGDRTAQMLMEIAKHPILSNPKFISLLPPSWGTLHKLADLPGEALEEMLTDGTITADTTSKDVDEMRKKIRGDGVYIWPDLVGALNILIKFQAKWPDPNEIAKHVSDSEDVEDGVLARQLAVLPQWLIGLGNACQELEEESARKEQLDRARRRKLECEGEADLDSYDEPVEKPQSKKTLSFAERTRREIAGTRMRLRNGSEFPVEQ
jgi:hypothetical protein